MENPNQKEALDKLIDYLLNKLKNQAETIDSQEMIYKFDTILGLIINKEQLRKIKLFYPEIHNFIDTNNLINQNEKKSLIFNSDKLLERCKMLENKIKAIENKIESEKKIYDFEKMEPNSSLKALNTKIIQLKDRNNMLENENTNENSKK